jgi:hypothetical protein
MMAGQKGNNMENKLWYAVVTGNDPVAVAEETIYEE